MALAIADINDNDSLRILVFTPCPLMLRESSERITLKEWLVIPVKAEKTIKSVLKIR